MIRLSALAMSIILVCTFVFAEDTRLLRTPDIHNGQVVFVYGGDMYTIPETGGIARKLTSGVGIEGFPKFSPDGKLIAFTAQYDGNLDVYIIPSEGGTPKRLTFHPYLDLTLGWTADSKNVIFRSTRKSGFGKSGKFHTISIEGGLPDELPIDDGALMSFSPDGKKIAFNRISREFRNWKRYKGGMAQDIWIYDIEKKKTEQMTTYKGTDAFPMWSGDYIYFISDRNQTMNVFSLDLKTKVIKQLTKHNEFDVKWPSLGQNKIVYENGGYIYSLDLKTNKTKQLSIEVKNDTPQRRSEIISVANMIRGFDVSPSGKRAVFSARGEIFTIPAKDGEVRQLTRTSGVRERCAVWSPDGKTIAYISDKTGEEEIFLKQDYGNGEEVQLTKNSQGHKFRIEWSPDSSMIAYTTKNIKLFIVDVKSGKETLVVKGSEWEFSDFTWAPDSKWLTYALPLKNDFRKVFLYSLNKKESHEVTSEMSDCFNPVFDRQGKYLFFLSNRDYSADMGVYEMSYIYKKMTRIYAVTLFKEDRSPFAPKSDEEAKEVKTKEEIEKEKEEEAIKKKKQKINALDIDIDGIQNRVFPVPVPPGNFSGLSSGWDKLLYISSPYAGRLSNVSGEKPELHVFDIEKKSDHMVLSPCHGYVLSARGEKLLFRSGGNFGITNVGTGIINPANGKLNTDGLTMKLDRRAEWEQIFKDAWRKQRDFFYAPNMHGVDWQAMYDRYKKFLPHVARRNDLNYVIGEMIAELNCSHAYVGGGDMPHPKSVNVGLLGVDFGIDEKSGKYFFKRIVPAQSWRNGSHTPLTEPGLNVKEGNYLLAVNGVALKAPINPYSLFEGMAGKVVTLTINDNPDDKGSRNIDVRTIGNESGIRYNDWVETNRLKVEKATNGRVGYVHVPNMGGHGLNEFSKSFYPQTHKEAMIIDVRYNGGGFVSQMLLEKLRRQLVGMFASRNGADAPVPHKVLHGPIVCITNHYAGSDGDIFPYFFKKYKLGTIVGKRTWGGTVGIRSYYQLIDGGGVNAPEFALWDTDKQQWIIEGYGVDPHIDIDNLPEDTLANKDPQLEKSIEIILEKLKLTPKKVPPRPKYLEKNKNAER